MLETAKALPAQEKPRWPRHIILERIINAMASTQKIPRLVLWPS